MRIQILILGFKGLKGRGHAICHPFKKFKSVFASIEFQKTWTSLVI